ncbi:hypothetical protein BASA50_006183 [Batrachochytrium salamandrivorans]|uniref:Uncharacterized protein n=1 Tax=Batrachochytrium salamandrivorans TaxID=1357716 RepID=A0ABQ8FAI6_9FUNG|nr:hypothetical protein BASA50_006183 [Batrachochytrium salamandrivorans]
MDVITKSSRHLISHCNNSSHCTTQHTASLSKRPTIFPRKLSSEVRSTASQFFLSRTNIPNIISHGASSGSVVETSKTSSISLPYTSTDLDASVNLHVPRHRGTINGSSGCSSITLSATLSQQQQQQQQHLLIRGPSGTSSRGSVDLSLQASVLAANTLNESTTHLWQNISERTLPLFSGQGVRGSVEEINVLVTKWIRQAGTIQAVQDDLNTFLKTGMTAITSKVSISSNEALANRLAEAWIQFFGTVLPLLQGLFLPVRWSPFLATRNVDTNEMDAMDIRRMALVTFRNYVVWPNRSRLQEMLLKRFSSVEHSIMGTDVISRMTQMLTILTSLSLNDDKHKAVHELLCVLRHQVSKGSRST